VSYAITAHAHDLNGFLDTALEEQVAAGPTSAGHHYFLTRADAIEVLLVELLLLVPLPLLPAPQGPRGEDGGACGVDGEGVRVLILDSAEQLDAVGWRVVAAVSARLAAQQTEAARYQKQGKGDGWLPPPPPLLLLVSLRPLEFYPPTFRPVPPAYWLLRDAARANSAPGVTPSAMPPRDSVSGAAPPFRSASFSSSSSSSSPSFAVEALILGPLAPEDAMALLRRRFAPLCRAKERASSKHHDPADRAAAGGGGRRRSTLNPAQTTSGGGASAVRVSSGVFDAAMTESQVIVTSKSLVITGCKTPLQVSPTDTL